MSNRSIYVVCQNIYFKGELIKQNLNKYKKVLNNWFSNPEYINNNLKKELEIEDCYVNVTTIINSHEYYNVFVIRPNHKTKTHIEINLNEINTDSWIKVCH